MHWTVVACLILGACAGPQKGQAGPAPKAMVWIPGGQYSMGCEGPWALPEERPVREVRVPGFWMDATEVTNAQFARFVAATGYVTTSERPTPLESVMAQLPEGSTPPPAEALAPGSAVFAFPIEGTQSPVGWHYVHGADWRHPSGPDSSIEGKDDHPVVQVTWFDAMAYAEWAGKALPTEAQWEFAARGGLAGKRFVWGDSKPDGQRPQLNMWQGAFPAENARTDGFMGSAPVASFAANGFGLYDMAGNAWEWCADAYEPSRGLTTGVSEDPFRAPQSRDSVEDRSLRGGSFLCSDNFCTRYRPSARTGNTPDSATNHTGFRCVIVPGD